MRKVMPLVLTRVIRISTNPSRSMHVTVRAEDIMTPRNLLQLRSTDEAAAMLSRRAGYDAVPISRSDGKVREFWNAIEHRRVRIEKRHRIAHDAPIESLLSPLGDHTVQFVHYRSELVGLVDASDLNKPLARLAWLHPLLELERAVLEAVRRNKHL